MKSQSVLKILNFWSRKLHIHISLFLLFAIWLFSYSGLLLNNGKWKISGFWDERKETEEVFPVQISKSIGSESMINEVMFQIGISGEIRNLKTWPDSVHFRVIKPGEVRNLKVNFINGTCHQQLIQFNLAGTLRTLHTFNGVDKTNPDMSPNWLITKIWRISMDGIAIGLLLISISSWIMWYEIRDKYRWGWVALISGFGIAVYFVSVLGII
jgi:hypothetical protein